MTKYNVYNRVANDEITGREIADNYVGDYIEADNAQEAIVSAIDCLVERLQADGYSCKVADEQITITYIDEDGNDKAEIYYNFTASEEEE